MKRGLPRFRAIDQYTSALAVDSDRGGLVFIGVELHPRQSARIP
jgi:hypothetical protein